MKKIIAFMALLAFSSAYGQTAFTIPNVAITGGTITGLSSPVPVASGGTGTTTSTGTGSNVLNNSPTLITPALGTPASGVATNLTGTASGLTAGTVTTNANLTGPITSVGNATTITSSVTLPGAPTTTTASAGDSSTNIATTGFLVQPGPIGSVAANTGAFTTFSYAQQEKDKSYTFNTPTTGQTVTLATGTETALIVPAGTLATLTVTLPGCTAGYDGSIARFSSTQVITTLTVNATSGTVVDSPTTLAVGGGNAYLCRGTNTSWYRLY